jgi:hypothetical protein
MDPAGRSGAGQPGSHAALEQFQESVELFSIRSRDGIRNGAFSWSKEMRKCSSGGASALLPIRPVESRPLARNPQTRAGPGTKARFPRYVSCRSALPETRPRIFPRNWPRPRGGAFLCGSHAAVAEASQQTPAICRARNRNAWTVRPFTYRQNIGTIIPITKPMIMSLPRRGGWVG